MILSRAQALKVSKRVFKTIAVEELDGELRLGSLSAGAAMAFNDLSERQKKGDFAVSTKQMMVLVFSNGIVDEAGKPLFDEAAAADFLEAISPATMTQISVEILKLSPEGKSLGNSAASPVAG